MHRGTRGGGDEDEDEGEDENGEHAVPFVRLGRTSARRDERRETMEAGELGRFHARLRSSEPCRYVTLGR